MATLTLACLLPLSSAVTCNPADYPKCSTYDAVKLAKKIKALGGTCNGTSPLHHPVFTSKIMYKPRLTFTKAFSMTYKSCKVKVDAGVPSCERVGNLAHDIAIDCTKDYKVAGYANPGPIIQLLHS